MKIFTFIINVNYKHCFVHQYQSENPTNNLFRELVHDMSHLSSKMKLLLIHESLECYHDDGPVKLDRVKNVLRETFLIDDPQLQILQLEYEAKAREIDMSLGEINFEGKSMSEIIEILAERKKIVEDKIGLSPKAIMETVFYLYPERFQPGRTVRRALPEFIQHH